MPAWNSVNWELLAWAHFLPLQPSDYAQWCLSDDHGVNGGLRPPWRFAQRLQN
jgi:hypothetical protein